MDTELRMPPHSLEAEHGLLGGLLLDNSAFDRVADVLADEDFYRHDHRTIYAAIRLIILQCKPADVITVADALESQGRLEEVGGIQYLHSLATHEIRPSAMRRYAEIVREKALLRRLIEAGDKVASLAYRQGIRPAAEIVAEAEAIVMSVNGGGAVGGGLTDISGALVQILDDISEAAERDSPLVGLATGFSDLDKNTAGLSQGDLVIIAGRPSMGKTSLAMNIAEHVAIVERKPVAVFSMEMATKQLIARMIGSIGRIDQGRMRTGRLHDEEWTRLAEAAEKLRDAPIRIDDEGGISIENMRARARRMRREMNGMGLIVVDYLQLMTPGAAGGNENRATELGIITRGLKAMAKEMQCPVIALSQLNRSVESRNDKRPVMSDLRESGSIEQDADIIMFVYRDEYYNKDSNEPGIAEVIISKQRNGPTGTVKMAFMKQLTKFESLARGTEL